MLHGAHALVRFLRVVSSIHFTPCQRHTITSTTRREPTAITQPLHTRLRGGAPHACQPNAAPSTAPRPAARLFLFLGFRVWRAVQAKGQPVRLVVGVTARQQHAWLRGGTLHACQPKQGPSTTPRPAARLLLCLVHRGGPAVHRGTPVYRDLLVHQVHPGAPQGPVYPDTPIPPGPHRPAHLPCNVLARAAWSHCRPPWRSSHETRAPLLPARGWG